MIDPYEPHPDVPKGKKINNILTLDTVRDIIDKQAEQVLNLSPRIWGFSRNDIVEQFKKVLKELEKRCQDN